jgi:CIC family chloride channel protein
MGHNPAPYVIIGMMCCFGGISRAPLAIMLMVAEMTGSLSMLAPAMIAVGLAWLIVRRSDDTIYRSQLKSRADAPAARLLAGLPLLTAIPTARAMAAPRLVLPRTASVEEALSELERAGISGAPVIDEARRFEGTVARAGLDLDCRTRSLTRRARGSRGPNRARLEPSRPGFGGADRGTVVVGPVLDGDRRVVGTLSIFRISCAPIAASCWRVSLA